MKKKLNVAIVGAGMGGLAVAATLRRAGIDVQVYEQASRFARIGAGIQMMPNSMKVLRGIGIEERLRKTSFAPYSHLNRDGYTGDQCDHARCRYRRATNMGTYRAALQRADRLRGAHGVRGVGGAVQLSKQLVGLKYQKRGEPVTLRYRGSARPPYVADARGRRSCRSASTRSIGARAALSAGCADQHSARIALSTCGAPRVGRRDRGG